jgi:NAD(P)H dehydrogenase (quinone)
LINKKILVTGASGKTGRAMIAAFQKNGFSVRALVHSPQQSQSFDENVMISCGDLLATRDLVQAMQGCAAVYHICPNMHPDEVRIGRLVIRAAQTCGVEHFVYHSVLHPQIKEMPHHWKKMQVEGLLFKSGLNYTILQPAAYMQNLLQYEPAIHEKGVYAVPYNSQTRIGMVDLRDVTEVAARVISDKHHFSSIYELATDECYSQAELTDLLSRICNRKIVFSETPRTQWEEAMVKSNMPSYAIATLIGMFEYYERFGFTGNGKVLETLLGHKPNKLDAFIKEFFTH